MWPREVCPGDDDPADRRPGRDAWAVAEDVAGFIGTSQAMLWRELVIEDIEDGSKAQLKKLGPQEDGEEDGTLYRRLEEHQELHQYYTIDCCS